jgi:hypothetical protein
MSTTPVAAPVRQRDLPGDQRAQCTCADERDGRAVAGPCAAEAGTYGGTWSKKPSFSSYVMNKAVRARTSGFAVSVRQMLTDADGGQLVVVRDRERQKTAAPASSRVAPPKSRAMVVE